MSRPTQPRIDAHHHLWDLGARPQPWMHSPKLDPLRRSFGLDDLVTAIAGEDVSGTVVVQTVADINETEELLDLAAEHEIIAGVVGYVDVAAPDVDAQLERLMTRRSGSWLVGVRSLVEYEPDPDWLRRPEVLAGLRAVAARGLVHDLLVVPSQLPAVTRAIAAVSDGSFVVDHLAKPNVACGEWEQWASAVTVLARCPNVAAKLSGLVTEADWASWTTGQLRPYVDHAVDQFGPNRLMFGSDWPVCTVAATYDEVVASIDDLTSRLSDEERIAIFGGSATRIYSLSDRLRSSAPNDEERGWAQR